MSKAGSSATVALIVGSLFIAGCATKGYVRNEIQPVNQKVDQIDQASQGRDTQQMAAINKTNQEVEEDERKLSATNELAMTADNDAKAAMAKANQDAQDVINLRTNFQNIVANIDDYKPAAKSVVHFAVNKDTLSKDDKAKLDDIATQLGSQQRYLITVEGFTDQTGSASYNDRLSRERADAVIEYLVANHDVPVYRIHTVGLGDQKLIDNGKGKKAREESRRVEIQIYTAKPLSASTTGNGGN